ncbi:hypothetical protein BSR29_02370 [Boudabousia liubingyangii]|uniref:Uncharacterized protein n=1 Tax=Boudabousia liubingyangii TaxID=1921764 RepID=A0A1Q5PQS4_9ACTO|nr:hypothetical protein BSR28_08345 [Boudabousia liubingyangii]OKL49886.1 hypothetical protein BSR29_02370 [Boudabousia liubingyangii]
MQQNYSLPPSGGTFETQDSFSLITDQLAELEKLRQEGASPAGLGKVTPETVWFEPGNFKSDALTQWQCAWLREGIIAVQADDTKRRDNAVQTLVGFKQAPEASMFPNYEDFLKDNVYPLREGKTENGLAFLNHGENCVPENQLK